MVDAVIVLRYFVRKAIDLPWSGPPKIGALIIGTGFWGPLYYNYNKEPLK